MIQKPIFEFSSVYYYLGNCALMPRFWIFFCLILCSCSSNETPTLQTLEILGRSDPLTLSSKTLIYRMQIPEGWNVEFPDKEASLIDTKEPLLTLKKELVTVTFHNFPASHLSDRIPPIAQVTRWKNQLNPIDESSLQITPFAVAGFVGLQFDASGTHKGTPTRILAWSLQLTPELFQKLPETASQQKADWTLKAVGSPETILLLEPELLTIARSVELIMEIPSR